jgi:hypothetical protein
MNDFHRIILKRPITGYEGIIFSASGSHARLWGLPACTNYAKFPDRIGALDRDIPSGQQTLPFG